MSSVVGACAAGMDSVLIASGIHGHELLKSSDRICAEGVRGVLLFRQATIGKLSSLPVMAFCLGTSPMYLLTYTLHIAELCDSEGAEPTYVLDWFRW